MDSPEQNNNTTATPPIHLTPARKSSDRPPSVYLPIDSVTDSATQSPNSTSWPFSPNDSPLMSRTDSGAGSSSQQHHQLVQNGSSSTNYHGTKSPPSSESRPFYSSPSVTSSILPTSSPTPTSPRSASHLHPSSLNGAMSGSAGDTSSKTTTVLAKVLDSAPAWIAYYFFFNLGLTLYNKLVLVKFPFPWTLTGIHTLCGATGAQIALQRGAFQQARLARRENVTLLAFSILYTVNIAVSNLSLNLVTVPFHQVVRAMTPLFTIGISVIAFHKAYSMRTYLSLVPIIAGVVFATYGDYYFTYWGLILTLLGTFLAALKTVVTNVIQVGRLKLHPLDLLLRMSPLAFIQCVMYAWVTGELEQVRAHSAQHMTVGSAVSLLINGIIAFGLNVVSFTANKKTSALTMTVAANVKQVLTIVLSVLIFNLTITPMNSLGISLTLIGGALYARVEFEEKKNRNLPSAVNANANAVDASLDEKARRPLS